MELSGLIGEVCTVGAVDVYKCFDQIQRQVLYRTMKEAGMPARVREASQNCQENLEVHNMLSWG